jgi:hypothetical protein
MWSYYGSKSKIAHLYPSPKYDTIVEPFAGAGWYSLLHRNKNIILNDESPVIAGLWGWLINHATPQEILSHTDFFLGDDISGLDVHQQHKNLIGFCINRGSVTPKSIVQKWSCQVAARPEWASTVSYQLKRAAKLVSEIKHWQIHSLDYLSLPDIEATWFIDPPYQEGGEHYPHHNINYNELAYWCKHRRGQVIVCENTKANWLPFSPLVEIVGQRAKTTEAIYTNNIMPKTVKQLDLFNMAA